MDAILHESIGFNPAPPTVLHIDLNSCFASIEQQANPKLRGKPVAVAAYTTPGGCILAASREAKALGISTGMRVGEGKAICPELVVLHPDPWKYRYVNRKLLAILHSYTDDLEVKSIDEMVLNLAKSSKLKLASRDWKLDGEVRNEKLEYPISNIQFQDQIPNCPQPTSDRGIDIVSSMIDIGNEIKHRIKQEIGSWLTVSIGLAPNRYLAKIAAGLRKPDGLEIIDKDNAERVFTALAVEDLTGIKAGYGGRLRAYGIGTALGFYRAPATLLRTAFCSVIGYHWWLRMHGWEADDRQFGRKSFGQSYALYKAYPPSDPRLQQILCQLVEKMARRMRRHGYYANGIHVGGLMGDYSYWHKGKKLTGTLYDGRDLYKEALRVLSAAPDLPVKLLAVSCHYLQDTLYEQEQLFADNTRKRELVRAVDKIAERFGEFTVFPARMLNMEHKAQDRIAFGGVKDLEEFVFHEPVGREPNPSG